MFSQFLKFDICTHNRDGLRVSKSKGVCVEGYADAGDAIDSNKHYLHVFKPLLFKFIHFTQLFTKFLHSFALLSRC